jgi:Predicted DNA-binding protein with PD1-like DNA-binding motif
MRSEQACPGRVFVLRLYDGEILHEVVEDFAFKNSIKAATVIAVGGAGKGSRMTVGPKVPIEGNIEPLYHVLEEPHELTGSGTIFPNEDGRPIMHMHCSCGREGMSVTGCVRAGVIAWLVMEVVITEIVGTKAVRKREKGFEILSIGE